MKKQIKGYDNYFIYDTGDVVNEKTGKKLNGKIRLNGYRIYSLSKNDKKTDPAAKEVIQYDLNLNEINHFPSCKAAG